MFSTQFRQSKTRKRSMPASAAWRTKNLHDVVGIVGVADRVGAAQQHLQQDVRHLLADVGEPLPRVLGEEAHGDVEGRAAPAFQRQELRQRRGIGRRDRDHVVRAHARGEQRLVRVAHGRVGDQHALLGAHPVGERLRARRGRAAAWCRAPDRRVEARRRHDQRRPCRRPRPALACPDGR